jgi:hypothetical protein
MSHRRCVFLLCGAALAITSRVGAQEPAKVTDRRPQPERVLADALWRNLVFGPDHPLAKGSEAAAMLATILKGGSMGGSDGWFGPGQSRYGWGWLAARHRIDAAGRIPRKAWRGPAETFDRLDRNRDGALTAADFDWSDSAPAVREERMYAQWFGKIDGDTNGRISREEWDSLFDRLAAGKDYLTADDLRRAFPLPAPPVSPPGDPGKSPGPAAGQKMPRSFQQVLLKGFFTSEVGSPFPGPRVDEPAPNFTLTTHDGKRRVTLSDFRGKKPVVLVFGSFT